MTETPATNIPDIDELAARCAKSSLHAWAHGARQCPQQPTFAYVNLTNICNYRCVMCGYKEMMRPERGFMSPETLAEVMDQLPESVYRIWLMKQGESLLHPQFGRMLAIMKQARPDIALQLATNASMMDESRCRALVEYMDYLDIGIHGTDDATLKKITRAGNLDRVMENITRLDRMIAETGSELTYNLTYVRQNANRHETDERVIDYFQSRLGSYNNIVIKWESNFQGNIEEANLAATRRVPTDRFPKCMLPYVVLTVLHDGKVSYCPAEAEEKVYLGDIAQAPLREIWNDGPMDSFRRALADGDFDTLEAAGMGCRDCTWPWSMETSSLELFVEPASKELAKAVPGIPPISRANFLRRGLIQYLNGQLGAAWESLQTAVDMDSGDEHSLALAQAWLDELKLILNRRYGDVELWEAAMNSQGRSLDDLKRKIVTNPKNR